MTSNRPALPVAYYDQGPLAFENGNISFFYSLRSGLTTGCSARHQPRDAYVNCALYVRTLLGMS